MNPFDYQRKIMEELERNVSSYLEKTMRHPAFMKLVTQNLEGSLDLSKTVRDQVQELLKNLSIPTEDEMSRLYETVNSLESRVLDLEEKLAASGASAPVSAPATATARGPADPVPRAKPRTRKAPARGKR